MLALRRNPFTKTTETRKANPMYKAIIGEAVSDDVPNNVVPEYKRTSQRWTVYWAIRFSSTKADG